jgi:hypothetical protein
VGFAVPVGINVSLGILLGLLSPDGLKAMVGYLTVWILVSTAPVIGITATALVLGFRIVSITAWPFKIYRAERSWHVDWPDTLIGCGYALYYPRGVKRLPLRLLAVACAGPLVLLLLIASSIILASRPVVVAPGGFTHAVYLMGFFAAVPLLANILAAMGGQWNIGGLIRALLRDTPARRQMIAQLLVVTSSINGRRPAEWDPELVNISVSSTNPHLSIHAKSIQYNWLLDTGDRKGAMQVLTWLLDQPIPKSHWRTLRFEAAWLSAVAFKDSEGAASHMGWAGRVGYAQGERIAMWKAAAAVAALEGCWSDARALADRAAQATHLLVDVGIARAIRSSLEEIVRDANGPPPPGPA